ncbi:hypothetical protein AL037_09130 [Salipiger aestuarii]|nr:hypothetical protein AL037_09130 [Salipiger aestuarii]
MCFVLRRMRPTSRAPSCATGPRCPTPWRRCAAKRRLVPRSAGQARHPAHAAAYRTARAAGADRAGAGARHAVGVLLPPGGTAHAGGHISLTRSSGAVRGAMPRCRPPRGPGVALGVGAMMKTERHVQIPFALQGRPDRDTARVHPTGR